MDETLSSKKGGGGVLAEFSIRLPKEALSNNPNSLGSSELPIKKLPEIFSVGPGFVDFWK